MRKRYLVAVLGLVLVLANLPAWGQTTPLPEKIKVSECLKVQAEGFALPEAQRVGFDVDDTLLFSTPAFQKGIQSGHPFGSDEFWKVVNSSDAEVSLVKQSTSRILHCYRDLGAEIFVITARTEVGGDKLRDFLFRVLAIPPANTFFEPHGKDQRIKELKLDLFIGDGDGDITDARKVGVKALRVIRSPESSYKKKYNPGKYGETIIPCTAQ